MATRYFKLRSLILQGKQIIPTKLKITFRLIATGAPTVTVWGVGHHVTVAEGAGQDPQILNSGGTATTLRGAENGSLTDLESTQVIKLNNKWVCTDLVVVIANIEHIAELHNMELFGFPTEFTTEEYVLT